jgi:hypothetical protein
MGADIVLGISLESATAAEIDLPELQRASTGRGPTWPAALFRALDLLQQNLTRECLLCADAPIRALTPPVSLGNFEGGPEFIEAGERAVEAARDRLRALLPWTEA